MGVRGMSTLVQSQGDFPFRSEVELENCVVSWHKLHNNSKSPKLLVDGMSVVRDIFKGLNVIFQGEWKEYVQNVVLFVEKLRRCGVEPVFYFDGCVEKAKHDTWIERREKEMKEVSNLLQSIEEGCDISNIRINTMAPGVSSQTACIISKCCNNVEVHVSVVENDLQIASAARWMTSDLCIGVLSNDTDFIFYDLGKGVDFFLLDRKQNVMENGTQLSLFRCVRFALAEWLKLDETFLPMVACLMGNDAISVHALKQLHKTFHTGKGQIKTQDLLIDVARWIKQKANMYPTLSVMVPKVQKILFPDGKPSMRMAMDMYTRQFNLAEFKCRLSDRMPDIQWVVYTMVERHDLAEQPAGLLSMLNSFTYYGSTCFDAPKISELPAVYVCLKGVLEKLYGFIYGGRRSFTGYMAIPGQPITKPVTFYSNPLTLGIQINECFDSDDPERLIAKQAVILAMWDCCAMPNELPDSQMPWFIVVAFVTRVAQLDKWEMDALLAVSFDIKHWHADQLRELVVETVSVRVIHLVTFINRCLLLMQQTLAVANFPWPSPIFWNLFHGKLFHRIHADFESGKRKTFTDSKQIAARKLTLQLQ